MQTWVSRRCFASYGWIVICLFGRSTLAAHIFCQRQLNLSTLAAPQHLNCNYIPDYHNSEIDYNLTAMPLRNQQCWVPFYCLRCLRKRSGHAPDAERSAIAAIVGRWVIIINVILHGKSLSFWEQLSLHLRQILPLIVQATLMYRTSKTLHWWCNFGAEEWLGCNRYPFKRLQDCWPWVCCRVARQES